MYDARNERHEFVGDTREAAVAKAVEHFGVEQDALCIGDFAPGDIYGLGGRAVIVAYLKDRKPPSPGRGESRGGDRDRDRGRGRDRGRDRDRGRSRDGGRDREGGRGRGRNRSERGAQPAEARSPRRPDLPESPAEGTVRGEIGDIGQFVLGALERMQIGSFEISESSEADLVAFEVTGDAAEHLARGDGRTVDALQLLANQVAKRDEDGPSRVVIDVEGNAEAREDFLEGLAERAADRARKTGRAVALDPMNGRDRRAIHLALRDEDDVATMSVGEGRYRQVVIVPEGAPEYERAVRESTAAARES